VRPISRRQHGFADYVFAVGELALPQFVPMSAGSRWLLRASALNGALVSVLTQYELGLVKIIPMRTHLAFDGAFAAAVAGAAGWLRGERPAVRGLLAGLGVAGGLIAALTDPDRA
jgi:hypothetical protein